jgi:hypothetical protein
MDYKVQNQRIGRAGFSPHAMTAHYHRYPDMFSRYMIDPFVNAMLGYRNIGFNGAALDEFGYMALHKTQGDLFRGRFCLKVMAVFCKERIGLDLIRTLFDMRYSPHGVPRVHVRAINNYFDLLRQGPLRVEQKFFQATAEIFGPHAFHGIHNTFHNHLDNDAIWTICINWWNVPRDYGQIGESTPMTARPRTLCFGAAHVASTAEWSSAMRPFPFNNAGRLEPCACPCDQLVCWY